MCVQLSHDFHTRIKESKQVCKFQPTIFTRLEPSRRAVDRRHIFFTRRLGYVLYRTTDSDLESQRHEKVNAWICALPTTHHERRAMTTQTRALANNWSGPGVRTQDRTTASRGGRRDDEDWAEETRRSSAEGT